MQQKTKNKCRQFTHYMADAKYSYTGVCHAMPSGNFMDLTHCNSPACEKFKKRGECDAN